MLQVVLAVFSGLMLWAALSDVRGFTIPNKVSLALLAVFPLAGFAAGFELSQWGFHLLGGVIALVLGMALFAPGWIGGGDAKLFAAASLWFGWPLLATFLIHTAMAGGILVIALLTARKTAPFIGLPFGWGEAAWLKADAPVPYGVALAAGAFWTLPSSAYWGSF